MYRISVIEIIVFIVTHYILPLSIYYSQQAIQMSNMLIRTHRHKHKHKLPLQCKQIKFPLATAHEQTSSYRHKYHLIATSTLGRSSPLQQKRYSSSLGPMSLSRECTSPISAYFVPRKNTLQKVLRHSSNNHNQIYPCNSLVGQQTIRRSLQQSANQQSMRSNYSFKTTKQSHFDNRPAIQQFFIGHQEGTLLNNQEVTLLGSRHEVLLSPSSNKNIRKHINPKKHFNKQIEVKFHRTRMIFHEQEKIKRQERISKIYQRPIKKQTKKSAKTTSKALAISVPSKTLLLPEETCSPWSKKRVDSIDVDLEEVQASRPHSNNTQNLNHD